MSHCPDRDQLELLLASRLDDTSRDLLESHVEACNSCQLTHSGPGPTGKAQKWIERSKPPVASELPLGAKASERTPACLKRMRRILSVARFPEGDVTGKRRPNLPCFGIPERDSSVLLPYSQARTIWGKRQAGGAERRATCVVERSRLMGDQIVNRDCRGRIRQRQNSVVVAKSSKTDRARSRK
jgi:hypothetical protein